MKYFEHDPRTVSALRRVWGPGFGELRAAWRWGDFGTRSKRAPIVGYKSASATHSPCASGTLQSHTSVVSSDRCGFIVNAAAFYGQQQPEVMAPKIEELVKEVQHNGIEVLRGDFRDLNGALSIGFEH